MASFDANEAQARMSELIDRSLDGEKITIATASGNIVMVSEEDWDSLVETLSVMLLPEVRERLTAKLAELDSTA